MAAKQLQNRAVLSLTACRLLIAALAVSVTATTLQAQPAPHFVPPAFNPLPPLETENYVLDIMGEPADNFSNRAHTGTNRALDPTLDFRAACRKLPIIMSRTIPMARIKQKPWGIQVAGNFRRSAAVNQWERERRKFAILKRYQPVVSRIRSPIGRRGIYAVRIGVDNRAAANQICAQLRGAGGACVVMRNR
jgi:hypothetical protein